jgi:hypothetical protein
MGKRVGTNDGRDVGREKITNKKAQKYVGRIEVEQKYSCI